MSESLTAARRPYRRELAAIFLVALALRIGYVAFQGFRLPPDTDSYRRIADNLVSGQGYSLVPGVPTAYRPPAYPVFIALSKWLSGGYWAAIWGQCVLGALVTVLAASLARGLVGDLFALGAAAIVAVDPYLVAVCDTFMTEALFAFFVTAFFASLMRALAGGGILWHVLAAVIAALAFLTRPEFVSYIPVVVIALAVCARRGLLSVTVFVLAFAVVASTWAVRNGISMGRPILTTTHGGYTHRLPYNYILYDRVVMGGEVWDSGNRSLSEWQSRTGSETEAMTEVSRDGHNYRMADGFMLADARRAAVVALYEAGSFWRLCPHGAAKTVNLALAAFFCVLAVLAVAGSVIAWRWGPFVRLAVWLLVLETVIHMYYWSNVRMRVPFHPLMAVAAAVAIAAMFRQKAFVNAAMAAVEKQPFCNPVS